MSYGRLVPKIRMQPEAIKEEKGIRSGSYLLLLDEQPVFEILYESVVGSGICTCRTYVHRPFTIDEVSKQRFLRASWEYGREVRGSA